MPHVRICAGALSIGRSYRDYELHSLRWMCLENPGLVVAVADWFRAGA
jgi:hypothetical protein